MSEVTVTATSRTIFVGGEFNSATHDGVQRITFADGTTWDHDQLVALAPIVGTGQGDTIVAPQNGATLVAGQGSDTFKLSGTGSDTIRFSRGDGHDTIDNPGSGYTRSDVLDLTDILPSEVSLARDGDAMMLNVDPTGDTVHVLWQFDGNNYGLGSVIFADGTTWDRDQIATQASLNIQAGPDDATISAPNGNATLTAGTGNDIFVAGDGNDTFVYAAADGNLTINVQYQASWNAADSNTLRLADLNPSDLSFMQQNDDLVIAIVGSGKVIDVADQFDAGGPDGIDHIRFAGGATWSRADIAQRLQSPG